MKRIGWICVLPLLILTGCGGEPSEADIENAVKSAWKQQMAALSSAMGGRSVVTGTGIRANAAADNEIVKSVEKIGCKEDGENAYLCDIQIEMNMGGTVQKQADRARMVKGSNGWALAGK